MITVSPGFPGVCLCKICPYGANQMENHIKRPVREYKEGSILTFFSLQVECEFQVCKQMFWTSHQFQMETSMLSKASEREEGHGNMAHKGMGFSYLLGKQSSFCESEHHCSKPTICKDNGQ